jgi:phosphoserine phosphatase RsbU/P
MGTAPTDPMLTGLVRLLEESHLATPDVIPHVAESAAAEAGWSVVVYLADYEQRVLVPCPTSEGSEREVLAIESSFAGLCYQRVRQMHGSDTPTRVWAPLVDGVERLGVLEVNLPAHTDPESLEAKRQIRRLALLVAHLIAVKSPYGDGLDRPRRRRPRTVASELLWQMLPPLTFACRGLVLSGMLEPCYEVAGDAFDYAVTERTAHMLMVDSTGHDLQSGAVSAAVLAAARKARREGHDLPDTVALVDETVALHFSEDRFATGVVADLDLATGLLTYVNAGHPAPLLMRGGRVVKSLDQGHRPMFGVGDHVRGKPETPVGTEHLEHGDRIVLYSDGVVEARDAAGDFFGVDRLVDTLVRGAAGDHPAPETLRRVIHAVLDHQGGMLQDDATMLIAEWASGAEEWLYPD